MSSEINREFCFNIGRILFTQGFSPIQSLVDQEIICIVALKYQSTTVAWDITVRSNWIRARKISFDVLF
jgi:hypothetical protein